MINRGMVPQGYKKTKLGIVPNGWRTLMVNECLERLDKAVDVEAEEEYIQIGIRSHGKGIFYKEPVMGKELGNKRVFWIEPDCFIVNIVFAWERAISKTTDAEKGMIASHRFPMYKIVNDTFDLDYLCEFFLSKRGNDIIEFASPGGAGRNRTLGQDRFLKSYVIAPTIDEQKIIVKILNCYNRRIELEEKLIEKKSILYKKLLTKLVTGVYRIKGYNDEWSEIKLGDIFEYHQPTPYIVESTDYCNEFNVPVLTAGKSLVLGYTDETNGIWDDLPVVIFDDFTTESKYIDFSFKVKSSAIKILKCRNGYSSLFSYYALQEIDYKVKGHERHWISKISEIKIKVPSYEEQNEISNIIEPFRREIILLQEKLEKIKMEKTAITQLLLQGSIRVKEK